MSQSAIFDCERKKFGHSILVNGATFFFSFRYFPLLLLLLKAVGSIDLSILKRKCLPFSLGRALLSRFFFVLFFCWKFNYVMKCSPLYPPN